MLHLWKIFHKKLFGDINYGTVRDNCPYTGKDRGPAHSICNLKFDVPNKIRVDFHKGSKYDYHFIIKELANEFSVPIKKQVIKIDKDGEKSVEPISYKIKFIDSMGFMATSLAKLVDNLSEGIHKIKWKDCGCVLLNMKA